MGSSHSATILAVAALAWGAATPASAQQKVLRIAMTAADVPTTTGMPNNGFDGMRFLGFPVLEGAVPVGPLARRPARRAPGSALRAPGSGLRARRTTGPSARRPEDLGLPPAPERHVPRRHALRRGRGGLKPGPLLHDRQPAVRAERQRHHPRPRPRHGQPPQARRSHGRHHHHAARQPPAIHARLRALRLATGLGGRRTRLGQGGAGPRRHRAVPPVPLQRAELSRNDGCWDAASKPKLDRVVLLPMPEANTRLAALRSGQMDWIEVPPPDGIPSRPPQ